MKGCYTKQQPKFGTESRKCTKNFTYYPNIRKVTGTVSFCVCVCVCVCVCMCVCVTDLVCLVTCSIQKYSLEVLNIVDSKA